jgi:hypothetical protein
MGAGGVGGVKLNSTVSADFFKIDMRTEIRKQMQKMLTGAHMVTVFVNISIADAIFHQVKIEFSNH